MTDAEFAAERMTVATVEVRKLLEETQWVEPAEAEAQARREAIAEGLKEFRDLAEKMVALFTRLS